MESTQISTAWDDRHVECLVDQAIASGHTNIKKSSMKLGPYNGFSGEMRVLADRKIKVAIKLGLIPAPSQCSVCGTKEERIDYHAEDYCRPLQVAPICMKCHMALHNRLRSSGFAESWNRRVRSFGDGTKWFEFINASLPGNTLPPNRPQSP